MIILFNYIKNISTLGTGLCYLVLKGMGFLVFLKVIWAVHHFFNYSSLAVGCTIWKHTRRSHCELYLSPRKCLLDRR